METGRLGDMEYTGKPVWKHFPGYGWFDGVVTEMVEVKGKLYGRIEYRDGDEEDLTLDELENVLMESNQMASESLHTTSGSSQPIQQPQVTEASQARNTGANARKVPLEMQVPRRPRSQRGMVVVPLGNNFSIRRLPRMFWRHRWEQAGSPKPPIKSGINQVGKKRSLFSRRVPYAHQDLKECIDCGSSIRPMRAPRRCRSCYQREYRRARKIQKLSHDVENTSLKAFIEVENAKKLVGQQAQHRDSIENGLPDGKIDGHSKRVETAHMKHVLKADEHTPKRESKVFSPVKSQGQLPHVHVMNSSKTTNALESSAAAKKATKLCPGVVSTLTDDRRKTSTSLVGRGPSVPLHTVFRNLPAPADPPMWIPVDQSCPYADEIFSLRVGMQASIKKDWNYFPGRCTPLTNRIVPNPSKIIGHLTQAGLLRLGEKLWYRGGHGRRLAEGWIVWNGILCGRCSHVIGPTEFEKCAGAKVRKPGKNIKFSNDKSLLQLTQMMAKTIGASKTAGNDMIVSKIPESSPSDESPTSTIEKPLFVDIRSD